MTPDIYQLGGAVVIALASFELVKYLVGKFVPSKDNIYQDKMFTQVSNHLQTLVEEVKGELSELRKEMRCYHEAEYEVLCKIAGKQK